MREVIIGILSTEEMDAETKFSETENVYKVESPFMYQNMGELIRCKDCAHYQQSYAGPFYECDLDDLYREENDYCSNAERKER